MEPLTESQFVEGPRVVAGRGATALPFGVRGPGDRERALGDDDARARSVPFRSDGFRYPQAALSPDGHWVAYSSNQSGRFEIYVESFPTPGRRLRVSTDGGTQPRWRRDQKELYLCRRTVA